MFRTNRPYQNDRNVRGIIVFTNQIQAFIFVHDFRCSFVEGFEAWGHLFLYMKKMFFLYKKKTFFLYKKKHFFLYNKLAQSVPKVSKKLPKSFSKGTPKWTQNQSNVRTHAWSWNVPETQ